MIEIEFDSNGAPLVAKASFLGDMVADYGLFLKEKNSNSQTILLEGDNLNSEDDSKQLPTPVAVNDGRRIKLKTAYVGNHPDQNTKYEIRLEIFQGKKKIGVAIEKNDETTKLTDKAQISLLLVKLNAV